MGLQDKWAAARERNRQEQEAEKARWRRNAKTEQLRRLGVPVPAWNEPILEEDVLDAMLAAEQERQQQLFIKFESAAVAKFRALGVQVLTGDGTVYTIGNNDPYEKKTNDSRLLGPLAGARAEVTGGTSAFSWGKAAVMPLATAPLARKETADAMVVFADGTVHTNGLDGSNLVREARKQAVQFNALAGTASSPAQEASSDPAAKLRKLQELLDAGLLSQEEYEAKRAQIISSI
jgi:Short C-terminal domain